VATRTYIKDEKLVTEEVLDVDASDEGGAEDEGGVAEPGNGGEGETENETVQQELARLADQEEVRGQIESHEGTSIEDMDDDQAAGWIQHIQNVVL